VLSVTPSSVNPALDCSITPNVIAPEFALRVSPGGNATFGTSGVFGNITFGINGVLLK
jgi:hypothetical protein